MTGRTSVRNSNMATAPKPMSKGHFVNKVAFVTGGASGIGRSLCEELGQRGAVPVVIDINGQQAEHVVDQLAKKGVAASALTLDVSDEVAVQTRIERTVARHGRVDILFNGAGIGWTGQFQDMRLDQIDRLLEINLHGALNTTRSVYPIMVRQGFGQIVNIASLDGLIPCSYRSVYAATKHALVGLSESLYGEARSHGVYIGVVCCGRIRTNIDKNSDLILKGQMPSGDTPIPTREMSATKCAQRILDGVARGRPMMTFAFPKPIWWLYRGSPALYRALSTPLIDAKMGRKVSPRAARLYASAVRRVRRLLRAGRFRSPSNTPQKTLGPSSDDTHVEPIRVCPSRPKR